MRRTQIHLTDEQDARITARAGHAGVAKAEIIRSILDPALGLDDGVAGRRRATTSTAGVLRDEDDWPQWLARVRGGPADERSQDLGT